ncbi:lysophospholipase catalytic domain-containing protein [Hyaloraphidium curvatum]|nr:lysophospholipase catalytic domain-containing protein [Hyaloraphidium curvatum]
MAMYLFVLLAGLLGGQNCAWTAKLSLIPNLAHPAGANAQLPQPLTYAPQIAPCGATPPAIRNIGRDYALSPNETAWLRLREPIVKEAWVRYLNNLKVPGVTVSSFVNSTKLPKVAMVISGGGYRAMLNGAGVFNGIDERATGTINGNDTTGGIAQLLTYLGGLSGGSWITTTLIANNFDRVKRLQENVWDLETNIVLPGGDSPAANAVIYRQMISEIQEKQAAGFNVTLTDLWGRGISRHLITNREYPSYGREFTFAQLADTEPFKSGGTPFPFIEADQQFVGRDNNFTNPWEWNVYESGSWATNVSGFIPTSYVGTTMNNGQPSNLSACVTRFDNFGFAVATSSAVFNVAIQNNTNGTGLNSTEEDQWIRRIEPAPVPNPFKNFAAADANTRPLDTILLSDGGNDYQVIPFAGVLIPSRAIDVVIAVDNTGDNQGYPAGASLIATQEWAKQQGLPFPAVPNDMATYVSRNLTDRVVFFGCPEGNPGALGSSPFILIYQPNRYVVYPSNTSTYKLAYNKTEADGMIDNGAAQWKPAPEKNQPDVAMCVGCALTARGSATLSNVCIDCLQRYCYPSTRFGQAPNPGGVVQPTATASITTSTSRPAAAGRSRSGALSALSAVVAVGLLQLIM